MAARERIGDVISAIRERNGWSQMDLGLRLEMAPSQISRHERGQDMNASTVLDYVRATGEPIVVTPEGWDLWQPAVSDVEFYGPAPCGTPLLLEDEDVEPQQLELGDVISEPLTPGRHFILQAAGDSMEPAVCDGDWIVVDRQRQPQMNEIVAANLNGGLTIKRVVPDRATGRPSLMPDNDRHPPIALDDGDELQMLGVVVGVLRQYIRLVGPDPIARAQQTRRRR